MNGLFVEQKEELDVIEIVLKLFKIEYCYLFRRVRLLAKKYG